MPLQGGPVTGDARSILHRGHVRADALHRGCQRQVQARQLPCGTTRRRHPAEAASGNLKYTCFFKCSAAASINDAFEYSFVVSTLTVFLKFSAMPSYLSSGCSSSKNNHHPGYCAQGHCYRIALLSVTRNVSRSLFDPSLRRLSSVCVSWIVGAHPVELP